MEVKRKTQMALKMKNRRKIQGIFFLSMKRSAYFSLEGREDCVFFVIKGQESPNGIETRWHFSSVFWSCFRKLFSLGGRKCDTLIFFITHLFSLVILEINVSGLNNYKERELSFAQLLNVRGVLVWKTVSLRVRFISSFIWVNAMIPSLAFFSIVLSDKNVSYTCGNFPIFVHLL